MTLRIATPEDRDLAISMVAARGAEVFDEFIASNKEDKIILFADDKAILIGLTFDLPEGKLATDALWWVSPSERNNNIGSELLEAFEFWATKVGCTLIAMTTTTPNVGQKYFESKGYTKQGLAYLKPLNVELN